MNSLFIEAPAKINWRLKILGRKKDGYHLLCSLMQNICLTDTIFLSISRQDSCLISKGPAIFQEDNLAYAAWLLLKRELGLTYGLKIRIEKRIPIGAGLGGGSADAAAVLKGANELFDLGLSREELSGFGLKLGADIPFCLLGGLAKAEGVGEKLTPLPLPPPLSLLLANPGYSVSTREVFADFSLSNQAFALEKKENAACFELSQALLAGDIYAIIALMENDLTASAYRLCPPIYKLAQSLRALGLNPLLCGSGGTLITLAENSDALAKAKVALAFVPWLVQVKTIGGTA
ncbi:MAG: 4-(cytidine 5'-diphospho)-2-C-methyl-D-erythritol kinase [Firmicutes bacterium]|nr:4-(cytidine 5'-diphospho)-2-C-methyl-D-erythritol kinase [Bacillota bacterium]